MTVEHSTGGPDVATAAPAAGRPPHRFAEIAPGLVGYTENVLFGDVWTRPGLSPAQRSLVTVACLVAGGNTDQLDFHLGFAQRNGLSEADLVEAITHLAFYAGWPKAMAAMAVAKDVFGENGSD